MTPPVSLYETEDHVIHSEYVEEDLHLWIARPVPGFGSPPDRPPVALWVLDGDLFFGTAVEMTRLMHQLYGELPPILVVGVAYGRADPRVQGELRTRDFTPTPDEGFLESARLSMPSFEPALPAGHRTGGAEAFLRFLVGEARPYVEARFDVGPGSATLFGSSLGGLFAVWAKLVEPSAFGRVIAVSPALWWDDGAVLRLEEAVAERRDDLAGRLFLAVGGLEEPEDMPFISRFKLISNVWSLAGKLGSRSYPSLKITIRVLDGETHTSAVPVGLTRGLRALWRSGP